MKHADVNEPRCQQTLQSAGVCESGRGRVHRETAPRRQWGTSRGRREGREAAPSFPRRVFFPSKKITASHGPQRRESTASAQKGRKGCAGCVSIEFTVKQFVPENSWYGTTQNMIWRIRISRGGQGLVPLSYKSRPSYKFMYGYHDFFSAS